MKDTATLGASAVAGGLLSKGALGIAPSEMKTPIVKGGIAVLALVAAASIQGKDTLATSTRGLLLGAGAEQAISAVADVIAPTVQEEATTTGQKFMKAMAGLNAAENEELATFEQFNIPTTVWDEPIEKKQEEIPFTAV
ncbi:hypothetical protein ACIVBQ_000559 [Tenacibaculum discolor]